MAKENDPKPTSVRNNHCIHFTKYPLISLYEYIHLFEILNFT